MAYPHNFSAFVDEEASDAVKRFCREPCKLKRGEIAADIDQRLTIGGLLCLARHRKTEMTADMHLLDCQLSSQCSSDQAGEAEAECTPGFQEELQEDDPQSRFDGPAQVDNAEAMGLPTDARSEEHQQMLSCYSGGNCC